MRAFQHDHLAVAADDFRQVEGRVARSRADIQHNLSAGDPSLPPQIEHAGSPDAMLHAQPLDFGVMGSDDVGFFLAHTDECKH